MATPAYTDVTRTSNEGLETVATHNASPQQNVERNTDPALDIAREHQHPHLHHSAAAVAGRKDDVVYTTHTTDEKSNIPHQDAMDNALHRRHNVKEEYTVADEEKAGFSPVPSETDPRNHTWERMYSRARPFIHVFIFLLMTG
jgi:CNT family concentrative nucleoside transporter